MEEFKRDLEVEAIQVRRAAWTFDDVNTEEIDVEEKLSFRINPLDGEDNNLFYSECEFKLGNEERDIFVCLIRVIFQSSMGFKAISEDEHKRLFVNRMSVELTLGQARSLLMNATSMAGLGTPLIIGAVVEEGFEDQKSE